MRGNSRRPHELQGSNGNGITRIGNLAVKGEESYINNDTKSNINWGEKQKEINRILIMRANFIILVSPKNFLFTYHNPLVQDMENGASLNTAMNLVSLYISSLEV